MLYWTRVPNGAQMWEAKTNYKGNSGVELGMF